MAACDPAPAEAAFDAGDGEAPGPHATSCRRRAMPVRSRCCPLVDASMMHKSHLALSGVSHIEYGKWYKPYPKHWGNPPNAQMKGFEGAKETADPHPPSAPRRRRADPVAPTPRPAAAAHRQGERASGGLRPRQRPDGGVGQNQPREGERCAGDLRTPRSVRSSPRGRLSSAWQDARNHTSEDGYRPYPYGNYSYGCTREI